LSDVIAGRGQRRSTSIPKWTEAAGEDGTEPAAEDAVVDVRRLRVLFAVRGGGMTTPVRDVSLRLARNERVGIVGESGSGKSLTAAAIAGLVDFPGRVEAERLNVMNVDPRTPGRTTDRVIGRNLAMVFQDPGEALNPAVKLGTQLAEPAVLHLAESRAVARRRSLEALRSVAIPDPARRLRQHQHELSGGMKQRVCIAIGLMGEARLLIADEPTTALDVTVQRQILRLVDRIGGQTAAALLFISHDIAVVAEICDRIVVMYAGFVVEEAATADLLAAPAHPYTDVLLAASPHMGLDRGVELSTIDGRMPGPEVDLPGCYFAARCRRADETCVAQRPALQTVGPGHRVACWHPLAPEPAPAGRAP
jgi:oligopeptide/dipeptide ABC transporter ATP-binding protein